MSAARFISSHVVRFSVAGVLATAAASRLAVADEKVFAKAGAAEMKIDEFRASLRALEPDTRFALERDSNLLNQYVRSLLVQRLVLQKALAKGWEQRPEVIAELERVRQNAIVESFLDSLSAPPPAYPSDAEARGAYEANKPALLVPRQFRLAQIFIALPDGANKTAAEKAQVRLDAVRASLRARAADFAGIARAESDEKASASKGGEIGWLTELQVQPEIRPKVLTLAKGAVSEPIRLGDGWHILKTLDIKEPYTPTFEAVRSQLVEQLRAARAKADRQTYVAGLIKENPVAVNELALGEAWPAAEGPAGLSTEEAANRPERPSFK